MKKVIAPLAIAALSAGLLGAPTADAAAPTPNVCSTQFAPSFSGPVNQPNHTYSCFGVEMQTMLGFQCIDSRCSNYRLTFLMRARRQNIPGWVVSSAQAVASLPRQTCNLQPATTNWTAWCNMDGSTERVALVAVTFRTN